MASVTLDSVCKVYVGSESPAVDRVNIDIADREFLVLVGPSGCGKSTTLRMVAGLEEVTEGTIRIGPRVVNDVAPKDRDIAMVFQNYALYPHMTVYKNMAFGLKMRKVPKATIDRQVRDAARMLNIEHLLKRKPKALSGGERQRVAVGRAIVRTPKAFLFDEPLSNLDARLRLQMRAELKRLHRKLKTTTIYVTHDQEEAMTLGDRIVVMKDGRVQQCATPLEVYHKPANRFVAGFVGIPPMNFFSGRIQAEGDRLVFDTRHGRLGVSPRVASAVGREAVGREMVYGARPEVLSLVKSDAADGEGDGAGLVARVVVVEPLGSDKDVYLSVGDDQQQVVARVSAEVPVAEGESIRLTVDAGRTHLFELGETGVNIGWSNGCADEAPVHAN